MIQHDGMHGFSCAGRARVFQLMNVHPPRVTIYPVTTSFGMQINLTGCCKSCSKKKGWGDQHELANRVFFLRIKKRNGNFFCRDLTGVPAGSFRTGNAGIRHASSHDMLEDPFVVIEFLPDLFFPFFRRTIQFGLS